MNNRTCIPNVCLRLGIGIMKQIKEVDTKYGFAYEVYLGNQMVDKVFIKRINKDFQGIHYIFLIDSKGKVIDEVFEYLNYKLSNATLSRKEQATTSLKLLFSYSALIDIPIEEFSATDVGNFSTFILGISSKGNYSSWDLKTTRSISTHNFYFDAIRSYLKISNAKNSHFFKKEIVAVEKGGFGMMAHTKTVKVEKYRTNLSRNESFTNLVPKYISINEYKKIIEYISERESTFTQRNFIIIKLMFLTGMRLGEILGLTVEDVQQHPDDKEAGILKLRNRLSDRKDQRAKGTPKPIDKSEYQTINYKNKTQEITLSPELMTQFKNYIDESRNLFYKSEKYFDNLASLSVADSVEKHTPDNYYIFLNKNGTPLTASGWSKYLKRVFVDVGISIDEDTKRDNLSHRFRHGYAMYLIQHLKKELIEVKDLMRHKSLSSTAIYFNPTQKEKLVSTILMQESIINKLKDKDND
jgi:integrase